ncbi:MAG: glycosyltransferase family 39 protein [Armatimonadota bacterium]|nr:glycosyltransferase family 39 protein [bacterium]
MSDSKKIISCLRYIVLIAVGFYALYFAGLGANPLMDPDEPIYGQFVKEMVTSGDWLTPRYGGQLWFDKPPMYYWLASSAVKTFGLSEFSVRLPSAVCAVGIVMMVFLLASHNFGRRTGVFAALVMATTLMQLVMSHAAATDAVMVFFITVALYTYQRWLDEPGHKRLGWLAACGAATGLGMLTKGPVVPLLLMIAFFVHLWWIGSLRKLISTDAVLGVMTALAIGLPWYVAMYIMHSRAFVDGFIITNNLARFAKPLHKSQTGHWYSYLRTLPIMLAFFLPWSVFLPQAIKTNWRKDNSAKLLIVWLGVVILFFSISKTQNFTYTYPAFPAAAILVGEMLNRAAKGERKSVRGVTVGQWAGLGIGLLLGATMLIFAQQRFPKAILPAVIMGASITLAFAVSLARRSRIAETVWTTSIGMAIFVLALIFVAMPIVSPHKSTKYIAHRIYALPSVDVVAFNLWKPGLLYYLDEKPTDVTDTAKIRRLLSSSVPTVIVCNERDERDVEHNGASELFGVADLDVYANSAYMRKQSQSASP